MTCQSRCSTTRPQTQQSIPFLTPFETDDLHEKAGEDKGHRPDPESWLACPRFGSSNSSCLLDATNPTSLATSYLHHTTTNQTRHTNSLQKPHQQSETAEYTHELHTPHTPHHTYQQQWTKPRNSSRCRASSSRTAASSSPGAASVRLKYPLFFPTHRERERV